MSPINHFFVYRTGNGATFQDTIYKPNLIASENIVVIEIDEESINSLSQKSEFSMLNIPKSHYIHLLEILKNAGAKAVGFDIVFQNPDKDEKLFADKLLEFWNSAIAVVEPKKRDQVLKELSIENDCTDLKWNANIEDYICPFTPRNSYGKVKWASISSGENTRSKTMEHQILGYDLKKNIMQHQVKYGKHEEISANSPIYTMGLTLALGDNNENAKKIIKYFEKKAEEERKEKWKIWPQKIKQPYFVKKNSEKEAGRKPYTSFSLSEIIKNGDTGAFDEKLKWAYVFVGESGELLYDTFISPVTGSDMPWVYSHAMLLDGILQDKIPEEISWIYTLIAGIIVTIFAVTLYFFLPKFVAPIVMIAAIIFTIFIARYAYSEWQILFDIFPFLLSAGLITYPVTYIYKFFIIEKDKRQILHAFSRYLSPNVVELIDANKIEARLGGEKKELSILFSDIADFTSISEKMDTKDLFVLMAKYLSKMTDILVTEKWTLDKYIGDAVMGFFWAPVDDDFHAVNACNTALKMRAELVNFNADLEKEWHEKIDFRVGIATGEVMVGNIGSERQFNYTVLGDTVNLASRLEATGKEYGVNIIIAASTKMAIGDMFLVRELDYIAVKWKNTGVRIFELLGHRWDDIDMTKYTSYESALRLYREGKFLEAGKIFEKFMNIDSPSRVMTLRCLAVLQWKIEIENGLYKMTHK